ncbi:High-affinity branched-chain amino acid transport system permease protein LivH [Geobacillus stearothermophilus]|uniref:High-affinity branched-chain amino acid transport system permease protein LivH n=1 Tax=Geobacillus stearothermophilus TaxID=1422 RepID=A0A150MU34_GEOSE|nr:High-affinity branched-chain amino acid transport system permease protein LivH [Geobacillus stearothermophilus]KYD27980.1 hypothetical protein B4109_1447 [Geobacillus stearothermophilus]OAO81879.1 High-affinity branched-chain amino acid transport system permease protein LivH [Geobacillus stearothermophilus]
MPIVASMAAVGLLGVLMERLVFYPLRDASPLHDKIAAIGILLFLEAFAQFVWGRTIRRCRLRMAMSSRCSDSH